LHTDQKHKHKKEEPMTKTPSYQETAHELLQVITDRLTESDKSMFRFVEMLNKVKKESFEYSLENEETGKVITFSISSLYDLSKVVMEMYLIGMPESNVTQVLKAYFEYAFKKWEMNFQFQ